MAYALTHVASAPCCIVLVRDNGDPDNEADTILIQTDWDWPGVAGRMGWAPPSGETDGTVDCPVTGTSASDMIQQARQWIEDRAGESFPDLDDYFI